MAQRMNPERLQKKLARHVRKETAGKIALEDDRKPLPQRPKEGIVSVEKRISVNS